MSDVLMLWALQEDWGGPLDKLAMVFVTKRATGHIAYGVTDDALMAWSGMGRGQARATLSRLVARGHLSLAVGRNGPGYSIGHLDRGEPIILRMGED